LKAQLPDLTISKFKASTRTALPGQGVYFDTEVSNTGQAPVDSIEISFGRGRRKDNYKLEGLEPGQKHQFRFGPVSGGFDGSYTYKAEVDPNNEIAESNEKNNKASDYFWVIDPSPPRPPVPPPRRP
jgi:subtilase family serine protease